MKNLLKTSSEITMWLDHLKISNYTLVPDLQYGFVVDVQGDVDLGGRKLNAIRVKFNHVTGYFSCARNKLTSLLGCPAKTDQSFVCDNNELTSLEFATQSVGGDFSCSKNKLTTLHFSPTEIKDNFYCDYNQLSSLEFCPKIIGGHFDCSGNQLSSLEFCPQKVKGNVFYCDENRDLRDAQDIVDFRKIQQLHRKFKKIKAEQKNLANKILTPELRTKKLYKI